MTPHPQENGLQTVPSMLANARKGGPTQAPPLNLPSCFQKITSHRGFAETVTQSRIRDTRATHCLGPGCTTLELSLAQLGVSVSLLNGLPIRDSVETPWGQKKQEKCKPVPVVLTKTPPIKVKAVSR